MKYWLPIKIRGTYRSSQSRQGSINEIREYIPRLVTGTSEEKKKRYFVDVTYYYLAETTNDVDNCLKVLFDAIKDRLMFDDRQIMKLSVTVEERSPEMGIKLIVEELPPTP